MWHKYRLESSRLSVIILSVIEQVEEDEDSQGGIQKVLGPGSEDRSPKDATRRRGK